MTALSPEVHQAPLWDRTAENQVDVRQQGTTVRISSFILV
jgi:hypothetical protein